MRKFKWRYLGFLIGIPAAELEACSRYPGPR
jgi:hypothetical protein